MIKKPLLSVLAVYGVCYLFRWVEYFFLRTDQTLLGEAILHKLAGIAVMFLVVKLYSFRLESIGFVKRGIVRQFSFGLLLGVSVFAIGYGLEILVAVLQGNFQSIQYYISSYAVDQNVGKQTGAMFLLICIVGNLVNVLMEEGIFRGLFQKILQSKYSFVRAAVIASLLFGLWHMIGPIRNYVDGVSSFVGMAANILMLVTTSALTGFKVAMLTRLTGSLYMAMGDHFVNNTIVNLLHVTSLTGADEGMVLRITVAQTVSFIVVLVCYLRRSRVKECLS